MKFPYLFTPIRINNLLIQNRIIMAPGRCGGDLMSRAGAGVVLIRGDHRPPEDVGDVFVKNHIDLRHWIDEAHAGGAAASCHIHHFGLHSFKAQGPIDGYDGMFDRPVRAMDEKDMEACIDDYVAFALKAKAFDFDMIDMHLGHGWLGGQFLSPYFNHRTDEYGGALENRMRFPLRLIKAVREALGAGFPLAMRWSATDFLPGGLSVEDSIAFVKAVEPYINAIEISAGTDFEPEAHVHSQTLFLKERMPNARYAKRIKEACPSLVVAVVGAILYPDEAQEIIANGFADMVSLSRAFLADPEWAIKAREGRDADIVPCLRCKQCYSQRNLGCSVNPRYDFRTVRQPNDYPVYPREGLPKVEKSLQKKVLVIGAGPAGIAAAVTASAIGHAVTLIDKKESLGGTLEYVAKSDYKYEVQKYLEFLRHTVEQSALRLLLNTEATPELLEEMKPDAIVLALGATPIKPPIPGIDLPHVMNCYEASVHKEAWGRHLVLIGGGSIGVEFALEQALKLGNRVTIVEADDKLAAKALSDFMIYARQCMATTDKIEVLLETKCVDIANDHVVVKDKVGTIKQVEADAVIYCVGLRPPALAALQGYYAAASQVYVAGDARQSRNIKDAVGDGYRIALNIT